MPEFNPNDPEWMVAETVQGQGPTAPVEAQEAKHDYAHEGYYVRLIPIVNPDGYSRTWEVWVKYGRVVFPACCKNKRTYVDEQPTILWEPRSTPALRRKTKKIARAS